MLRRSSGPRWHYAWEGAPEPRAFLCWRSTQLKRVLSKFGVPGHRLLSFESMSGVKCFHAGGKAKHWIDDGLASGTLRSRTTPLLSATPLLPYVRFRRPKFEALRLRRRALQAAGYYRLVD